MKQNTIKLNENELYALVNECVKDVLEEGFFDQIKAGWNGAKQGLSGQKMLDRGVDNFNQYHQLQDLRSGNYENTASEQAREAYSKYKEYQAQANKFLNLYNKLVKTYNLKKVGVGKVDSQGNVPSLGIGSNVSKNFRNKYDRTKMPNPNTRGFKQ